MDSRSQIDIVSSEDATMLSMSQELDQHTSALRKGILESLASMRQRIHQQASDLIEGERNIARENEKRLLQQIENLQSLLAVRTQDLQEERQLSEGLLSMHQRQKVRHATQMMEREAFLAWRQLLRDRKQRERMCAHLTSVRHERQSRILFFNWRLEAYAQQQKETIERLEGEQRRNIARLTNENHTSENKLKLEMLALREDLKKKEESLQILEERLRASFMKGVCALNMEAMHVLRGPQGTEFDTSIASLLQNMNVSGLQAQPSVISAEPGTTERLARQQQILHEQLMALNAQHREQPEPENAPPPRPSPQVVAAPQCGTITSQAQTTGQQATITINPQYPLRSSAQQQPTATTGPRTSHSAATGRWKF